MVPLMSHRRSIAHHLVAELQAGRIRSVAFVVPSDARLDVAAVRPGDHDRPARLAARDPGRHVLVRHAGARTAGGLRDLEPEGITFIGSTYADVRGGVVLLDPQDERIEPDRIVSLNENGELLVDWRATNGAVARRRENVAKPPGRL